MWNATSHQVSALFSVSTRGQEWHQCVRCGTGTGAPFWFCPGCVNPHPLGWPSGHSAEPTGGPCCRRHLVGLFMFHKQLIPLLGSFPTRRPSVMEATSSEWGQRRTRRCRVRVAGDVTVCHLMQAPRQDVPIDTSSLTRAHLLPQMLGARAAWRTRHQGTVWPEPPVSRVVRPVAPKRGGPGRKPPDREGTQLVLAQAGP